MTDERVAELSAPVQVEVERMRSGKSSRLLPGWMLTRVDNYVPVPDGSVKTKEVTLHYVFTGREDNDEQT